MESRETYRSTRSLFTPDELEQQLQRILQARPFCDAPRLRKFLSFVVKKTAEENPEVITSYEIAIDAFGRSSDFDPNDPYIRNIAVLVRKALDAYYKELTKKPVCTDLIRIEIPRGNYLAKFTSIKNLPVASKTRHRTNLADIEDIDSRYRTKPKITQISKNSPHFENHISVNDNKPKNNNHQCNKPLLAISPFVSFGSENCIEQEAIGEILAAEIITGFSQSESFGVFSLLNSETPKNSRNQLSVQPAIKADYLLNGKYQITEGVILINIELSKFPTRDSSHTDIFDTKATIIFSELLRLKLDSFYSKRNEELQTIGKRVKMELNQLANPHQEFSNLNPGSFKQL